MAEKTIEEKVKDIIVEQLGVNPEQVTTTASFIEDLGADSLDTVELVMAFEEEFSVEVPDEDAEKLQTVGDVVKYIEEKTAKKFSGSAVFHEKTRLRAVSFLFAREGRCGPPQFSRNSAKAGVFAPPR